VFLKRITHTRRGQARHYWVLVESYRTPRGPRHRVVGYLGELASGERKGWARLAAQLDGNAAAQVQQLSLFEPAEEEREAVPERVEVEVRGVRVKSALDYGDVFLGLALWRMLGLDAFFERELPRGREEVPWSTVACILTLARLLEPSSELHIEDTWYRRTALPKLLGASVEQINDTRLYRALDVVLPLKTKLEAHLKERVSELFKPDLEILFYDVTSTYFEGLAARNPQAQYGYSRDHRFDCKQVCIGVVVTKDGFPLGYEVFDGNRHDVTTLEEMVEALEEKYGRAQRIWVFDRGIVNEENLEFIRNRGGRYVVGTPKALLKRFEAEMIKPDWKEVEPGVEVKRVVGPDGQEIFVLCRSRARREKERAMHDRFVARVEEALGRMQRGLERAKKPRRAEAFGRQIGRLLERNSRASKAFSIEVLDDPSHPSGLRLKWTRVADWQAWADLSEGCYLLRTNLTDQSPEELWRTYIQLTDVEAVFRTQKSELKIRPLWHQVEQRVQAHVLFSFLAYALWKCLQAWMERARLGSGTRTVLEEVRRIKANEVVLRASSGRDVRLYCITRPDAALKVLLDHLGLVLPERLGRPAWVPSPVEVAPAL
jgi:transposase